jgi:hypothetical protein
MLGFYAYLPDITVWLRMQPEFPFKNYLLELDAQTLQLVIFTFLLFIILAKVSSFQTVFYELIRILSFILRLLFGIVMVILPH